MCVGLDLEPKPILLDIRISTMGGGVMVNNATVIAADVMASNGVIHGINAVILPPDVDVASLLKK